jgi:DNA-binding transcriptional MerR regulator
MVMGERLYTQGEVNGIYEHIPSRTLRFWVESGLVEWADEHEDRRGRHRQYSFDNLLQLGLVEELMSLNLTVKTVKNFMLIFHGKRLQGWESYTLILNKVKPRKKEEYELVDEEGRTNYIAYKVPGWHSASVIPTESIITELDQAFISESILLIMVNLQNITEKVTYLINKAEI